MVPKFDLTGQRFGRWTVQRYLGKRGRKHMWLCRCECGREHEIEGSNLRDGRTTQCRACRHSCMVITHGGVSLTTLEWARVLGVSKATLYRRLKRFPIKIALQEELPPRDAGAAGHFITFHNTTLNGAGWAARLGLTRQAMAHRLSRMSVEEALTRPVVRTRSRATSRG